MFPASGHFRISKGARITDLWSASQERLRKEMKELGSLVRYKLRKGPPLISARSRWQIPTEQTMSVRPCQARRQDLKPCCYDDGCQNGRKKLPQSSNFFWCKGLAYPVLFSHLHIGNQLVKFLVEDLVRMLPVKRLLGETVWSNPHIGRCS